MSNAKEYAEALESGSIPRELLSLQILGSEMKNNPEKYNALRNSLLTAKSDEERVLLLEGFTISESQLRRMSILSSSTGTTNNDARLHPILVTIIITTIIGCPGTLHSP